VNTYDEFRSMIVKSHLKAVCYVGTFNEYYTPNDYECTYVEEEEDLMGSVSPLSPEPRIH
jgi:hypothetical protein